MIKSTCIEIKSYKKSSKTTLYSFGACRSESYRNLRSLDNLCYLCSRVSFNKFKCIDASF